MGKQCLQKFLEVLLWTQGLVNRYRGISSQERLRKMVGERGLTGEKADQYFDAVAKCRRARDMFLRPTRGRRREVV